MARARKSSSVIFDTLTLEGGLIAPATLERVAAREAGEQDEQHYNIPKGLTIRDEIARYYRIGQAHFTEFSKNAAPSLAATVAFTENLLRDAFCFSDLEKVATRTLEERDFPVTLEALGGRIPVVITPPSDDLDRASDHLSTEGRRSSANTVMQDWLNANDAALWGFCTNGDRIRLLRDNASLTRPAYVEANLRQIFETENFADFAALWLLVHVSRFGQQDALVTDCALERWKEAATKEGVAARDRLREGVETALLALGNGFLAHPANAELVRRIEGNELPLPEYFTQLLRFIYRLIFLLVAEDRNLLYVPSAPAAARKLYAEGYSLNRLRHLSVRRAAWDRHHDKWEGLLTVFTALSRGEPLLGLPALGGLFGAEAMPDLEKFKLGNRPLMEAIYSLAWLKEDGRLTPINWRDMETEELGSVYESLLELTPQLNGNGRTFKFAEGAETRGNTRKTTGSYYTPDSLVQALLDRALDPVLEKVEAQDPQNGLLTVTVIDPACGSGHFLLAAARRIAGRLAKSRSGGAPSAEDYRHALRDVARNCIYGVDRNPMAVELTKVALWIETVEPGKPLGFLDANIRCGDSLFGVFDLNALRGGIPDEAYKPLSSDDKETAKHFARRNRAEREGQGALDFGTGMGQLPPPPPLAAAAQRFRALPEDSVKEIADKRREYETVMNDPRLWNERVAADLYVAAFLMSKIGGVPANRNMVTIPTTAHVWDKLHGRQPYGPLVGVAQALSVKARAFHWPLEFPDIFAKGGFDVVIGNPPWERMKLQEQEFFASRDTEIADASNKAARQRLIDDLADAPIGSRKRLLFEEFETTKRLSEASSLFARESGRYPLAGVGDVNTYALFAEHFKNLRNSRGRAGVIVPTGIATDATTAPFFSALVAGRELASIVDFENREAIFQSVHRSFKFCLLVMAREIEKAEFSFFLTQPAQMLESERRFRIATETIARMNPNTKTAPIFRSRADAELTAKIYDHTPVLIDETKKAEGNSWGAYYLRLIHFGDHASELVTGQQAAKDGFQREADYWVKGQKRLLPVWESKLTNTFDLRYATFTEGDSVIPLSSTEKITVRQNFRYWVSEQFFESLMEKYNYGRSWFLAYRDVARATDERSVIALALPREPASIKLPVLGIPNDMPAHLLLANFNTLSFDYVARQKIGGISLSFFILKQLPVIPISRYQTADIDYISSRVSELVYNTAALGSFASELGYTGSPFSWNEERRAVLRAELDVWYAKAYGLSRDELRYILDPADVMGQDYPSETFRVLKEREIRELGEYRTRRLVLEAWDRMEAEAPAAKRRTV